MKRCWIGFILLLVLLAGGLLATWTMDRIHEPIEADLKQAAECAVLGDWVNADHFFRKAKGSWEKWEHLCACFADHTPMEEIRASFAMQEVYCDTQENAAFAAGCCELAQKVSAMGESHGLVWWNVL